MNKPARILVVDDDPAILQVISVILRDQGHEVWGASTGAEGLRMTRERRPSLVLLDVNLPDLSGIEVCRQIKADTALADVFVALFSGEATDSAQKSSGLEVGADDYMVKPLQPVEFLARIRTLLRLRNAISALRASEGHYHRLVDILPDAVALIDPRGRVVAANPQAVAMMGYDTEAGLLGKNILDLAPPEEHDRIRANLAATLETGGLRNVVHTALRKNGERFPVEINSAVSVDGNGKPAGVVAVVRDLSARTQADEALRESEEKFRQVTENINEVFWMTDPGKNEMLYVSPAYDKIWGRSRETLHNSPQNWMEAIHPEDRQRVAEAALTKQSSGQYHEVYRIARPDGSIRWIQDRAFPVRDKSGNVYRIVGVAEDITERKRTEEEMLRLPHLIIEAQEIERLRVARELHDGVNQLLASAKMRLLKVEESIGPLSPAAREIIARCNQLLVRALEENRRIAYNLRPSDLDELGLPAACKNLCREFEARTALNVKPYVARTWPRLPPAVRLNLFRIVQEALHNVEQHARAKTVWLRMTVHSGVLQLSIRDDGCGFDPHGARPARKRRRGIGLTNMRERAASVGGSSEMRSGPEQGTTITVRVPWRKTESGKRK